MRGIRRIIFFGQLLTLSLCYNTAKGGDIYVQQNASSSLGDGSKQAPFSSLEEGLQLAREWRRLDDDRVQGGINIWVGDGLYTPSQTILIRPEDSGTKDNPTRIKSVGDHAIFSGGIAINNWTQGSRAKDVSAAVSKKLWVADAPKVAGRYFAFRQLWVNGNKAVRAESHDDKHLPRILNWNFKEGTATIPNTFGNFQFKEGMEFFIHQWWAVATLRVAEASVYRDSIVLQFHQPEAQLQNQHPWPKPWLSTEHGNSAFRLVNALSFLDEPGEWFLDEQEHKVYYYPLEGEKLASASIVAPFMETILKVTGTLDAPVSYVSIQGLNFQHSTWMRPHTHGHVALQAGMYFVDAYKLKEPGTQDKKGLENQAWVGRPKAAVVLKNTAFTSISDCSFMHLASTGVDYLEGNFQDSLQGNLFQDIGGSAVLLGKFSDEHVEAHLPYQPTDQRLLTDGVQVENNLIQQIGTEDWGTVGIGAGFVRNVKIEHNELMDLPYTGISLGWGWTPSINSMRNNLVRNNRIVRYGKFMYDVAGIYTLSAQPGTRIERNLIDSIYVSPYAHLPEHWFYLYTDEGSAYMSVQDNWFPANKILQNSNGPNVDWKNNGPQVDPKLVMDAGLQPKYRLLRKHLYRRDEEIPFNVYKPFDKPVFFQIYDPKGMLTSADIESFVDKQGGDTSQIYRWKDYTVVMASAEIGKKFSSAWLASYPTINSALFKDLFYSFDRDRCGDQQDVEEKDFVLLSAQLVDDKEGQEAYLDAHETQYEKWPEVAQGFCQAGFQQVFLYRSQQQLMLFISFAKGQKFEIIDPLTTKDNPRVEEWNKLMSTYQQGIEGTAKDETWIFFKK